MSASRPSWAFDGVRCLVTGAAGGIGETVVEALLAAGARVAAHDVDEEALVARFSGSDVVALSGDLSDDAVARRLPGDAEIDLGGALQALVHCAGIMATVAFEQLSSEAWRRMIDVNLTATFTVVHEAGLRMREAGGAMVLFSSVAGRGPRPAAAHYAASKAGVISLGRSAAVALGPTVRVNTICPGVVPTRMWDGIIADRDRAFGAGAGRAYLDDVVGRSALRRHAAPREIADVALFLLSDAASFVTGQAINVDGGLEMA